MRICMIGLTSSSARSAFLYFGEHAGDGFVLGALAWPGGWGGFRGEGGGGGESGGIASEKCGDSLHCRSLRRGVVEGGRDDEAERRRKFVGEVEIGSKQTFHSFSPKCPFQTERCPLSARTTSSRELSVSAAFLASFPLFPPTFVPFPRSHLFFLFSLRPVAGIDLGTTYSWSVSHSEPAHREAAFVLASESVFSPGLTISSPVSVFGKMTASRSSPTTREIEPPLPTSPLPKLSD